MTGTPLVSIGVPTCDRASLLERAIESLLAQDYPNLEIIISDNASTDDTLRICERAQEAHRFVYCHRTSTRVPAVVNFRRVLLLATGQYFMWAADDDLWAPDFVSTLVDCLESDGDTVLVAGEAQYMLPDGTKLPFFPEGASFYNQRVHSQLRWLLLVAAHNYGNLIYGLYRRETLLFKDSSTALDVCRFSNENPLFLQVAARGAIRVCDRILFYKTTSLSTYLQAAREYGFKPVLNRQQLAAARKVSTTSIHGRTLHTGGRLAKLRRLLKLLLKKCGYSIFRYHVLALADIRRAIWRIDVIFVIKLILLMAFIKQLTEHSLKLVIVWHVKDVFHRRTRV